MLIRPGLHRIEAPLGERFVALHLLVGPAGALLVDTGIRESITETLLPYLAANDIDPESVRWAINTHCDFDHTGGNGALKAAIPGVELLVHQLDRELTENVQRLIDVRYGEFRVTDGFDDPPETTAYLRSVSDLVPVDGVVTGGEQIDLGDRVVTILHVPGHSPGHIAVHDPSTGPSSSATRPSARQFPSPTAGRPSRRPTATSTRTSPRSRRSARSTPSCVLTAHYPVYEGAAATAFLDESVAYTERIDAVLDEELQRAAGPSTTLELVRSAGERLGPWNAGALDYAVFPVTGNLERMQRRGLIRSETLDGRRRWSVAQNGDAR